jgi:hypothetical protein
VVVHHPGRVLLAVIDGLGHGPDAVTASRAAAVAIERYAAEAPDEILQRCHEVSTRTRGSVITVAAIGLEAGTLTWAGVGNVAGVVLRTGPPRGGETLRAAAGIVGSRIPVLKSVSLPLGTGDLIVLASDGIRPHFASVPVHERPLQAIADWILAEQGRETDDAHVLVASYQRR